jgi:hypothetical protein
MKSCNNCIHKGPLCSISSEFGRALVEVRLYFTDRELPVVSDDLRAWTGERCKEYRAETEKTKEA